MRVRGLTTWNTIGFMTCFVPTQSLRQRVRSYWQKLGEGGTITEPLATAPWGASFGMFTDRFGVNWLVNIAADAA